MYKIKKELRMIRNKDSECRPLASYVADANEDTAKFVDGFFDRVKPIVAKRVEDVMADLIRSQDLGQYNGFEIELHVWLVDEDENKVWEEYERG